jgi:hypothetical protein
MGMQAFNTDEIPAFTMDKSSLPLLHLYSLEQADSTISLTS